MRPYHMIHKDTKCDMGYAAEDKVTKLVTIVVMVAAYDTEAKSMFQLQH